MYVKWKSLDYFGVFINLYWTKKIIISSVGFILVCEENNTDSVGGQKNKAENFNIFYFFQ